MKNKKYIQIEIQIFMFIFIVLLWFFPITTFSEDLSQQEEIATYENIQFNNLNNIELIQSTENFYTESSKPFFADIRAVTSNEQQLILLQKKIDTLKSQLKTLTKPEGNQEDEAHIELMLNYSEKYFNNLTEQENILSNQKTLLIQQISQIETAQLSADVFIESFGKINLYLLEIQLREMDNILDADKIPSSLKLDTVKLQEQSAHKKLQQLQQKLLENKIKLEQLEQLLDVFSEKLQQAEVERTIAKKSYDEIIEQKEIRQDYSDKTIQELKNERQVLDNEAHWLKRHSNELFQYLKKEEKEVSKQEEQLKQQKNKQAGKEEVSNITKLQSLDTNNVQEAEKMTEKVISFYDKRLRILQSIQDKLDKLEKTGESLNTEITIFQKHLLKTKVLTRLLKDFSKTGEVDLLWIQKHDRSEELLVLDEILNERLIEVFKITEESNKKKVSINTDIKASKQAKIDVTEKMQNMKKMFTNQEEILQWENTVENMPTEKLVDHFKEMGSVLEKNKQQLKNQIIKFEQAKKVTEESRQALDNIRDPLWQLAKKESLESENEIIKMLYKFSNLELPEKYIEDIATSTSTVKLENDDKQAVNTEKNEIKDKDKQEKDAENSENKNSKSDNLLLAEKDYQDTLSSWLFVFTERKTSSLELSKVYTDMQKNITEYSNIMIKTRNTADKYHTDAEELKKRLIKNPEQLQKFSNYQLTENINKALKTDFLEELDIQSATLLTLSSTVKQHITDLNMPDKLSNNIQRILKDTEIIHSKQIEKQLTLEELAQEFSQQREDLSKIALERITQDAIKNLKADDNFTEILLNGINSNASEKFTTILISYYIELIEISNKNININHQEKNINHLIDSMQNEKPLLEEIIGLLTLLKKKVELERDKLESSVKITLDPQKTDEISQQFLDKTGEALTILLAIEDKEKELFIEKNAHILFNYEVSLLSLDKWTTLFRDRVKPTGLDNYIGNYQNKLGKLSAEKVSLQQSINSISGNSSESVKNITEEEKPKTAKEKLLFSEGKVGVLRNDRYQINKEEIISLLIRLFVIILITFILLKLTNYIFNKLNKNNDNDNEADPQSVFIRTFFKAFIKISIWSITILMILSNLGFQIGTILAGLGIGGFAIAIAAKETLSNILSGITLFIEKPFKIGDTIKINDESPQKVVNMTWRSTQLVNSNLYYSNIPNSTVADANLINYTKNNSSIDYVDINLLPKYDSSTVIDIMRQSLDKLGDIILQDAKKDVKLVAMNIHSETPFVLYRIKFCIADYPTRGGIRNQVLTQIKQDLEANDIFIAVDIKVRY